MRRKAWFRVQDQIAHDPLSNDQLATLVRLMAWLNTRWARHGLTSEESGCADLGLADLYLITGKHRRDVALRLLQSLSEHVTMSVQVAGRSAAGGAQVAGRSAAGGAQVVRIKWCKFPIFQEYPAPPPPPPLDAPSPSPNKRKRRTSGGNKSKKKTLFPGVFPDEGREALLRWGQERGIDAGEIEIGIDRTRDWAQANGVERADWVAQVRNIIRNNHEKTTGGRDSVKSIRDEIVGQIRAGSGEGGSD